MATSKISCAAPALLLAAALLAAGAGADWVTVEECRGRGWHSGARVRQYPEDTSATELWVDGCGLTELIPADLDNLLQVYRINLDSNSIERLNTSALRTVPALTSLWLDHNKFREPPVFAEGSCSNLTFLYLSYNMLTAVGAERTFSACRKLVRLSLDYNLIQYVHPDAFHNLSELTYLTLSNNRIKFLPNTTFRNKRQLTYLDLSHNSLTHLPPDFAISLKRAGAGLEEFNFHGNPWHCACLLESIANVKRAGVRNYNRWHDYNGAAPVCVYTDAAPCCRRAPSGLLPAGGAR